MKTDSVWSKSFRKLSVQGSIFQSKNDIYSLSSSENDIFPLSRDTLFFDSHCGLFALSLPYFAIILPFYFPFPHFHSLSSFSFPLSSFFFYIFPLFLFAFSYFSPQMTLADIAPPPGGGGGGGGIFQYIGPGVIGHNKPASVNTCWLPEKKGFGEC